MQGDRADESTTISSAGPHMRSPVGLWKTIISILAIAFSAFYIYTAAFGIVSIQSHHAVFVGASMVLGFLLYPSGRLSKGGAPSVVDILLAVLAVTVTAYFIQQYPLMVWRVGALTNLDIVMGAIAAVLSIEIARRASSPILAWVALIFLLYAFVGPFLPGSLGHGGYDLQRVVGSLFSLFGIYGSVAGVFATFVFIFVIFGNFLERSGASRLLMDLPIALLGSTRGGPAKVAVVSSAFFGSISGSAVANVMVTGTFTIPLMKKIGYKPHVAGAIEAAASTGGGILPPVMGAAAFLLAEMAGVPYKTVALVSIIPGVLYFLALFIFVHMEAVREGIEGMPRESLPSVRVVLLRDGIYLAPLAVMVYMLAKGMSPSLAALSAIGVIVVIGLFKRENRIGIREFIEILEKSGKDILSIGATVGSIGIIVGITFLTGLGLKFSAILVSVAQGVLPLGILLVALAAYVLGMGISISSSYMVLAVIAAPALVKLGLPLLPAHMITMWFCQSAAITPPVALASFAGASIAEADPMKTGMTALRYGSGLLLIPFLFAYTPILFPQAESMVAIVGSVISSTIGMVAWCAVLDGFLIRTTRLLERSMLAVAVPLLFRPGVVTDAIGLGLVACVVVMQVRANQRAEHAASKTSGSVRS